MLRGIDRQRRALGLHPAACLAVVRRALACRKQSDEARAGSRVLDDALPRLGQRRQLAQPLNNDFFDLRQRGSGLPRDPERSEPRGGQVAQHRTQGRVGREPAEVARVLNLGHARHDDAFEVGQHPAERFGLLRRPARQLPRHLTWSHLRLNRHLRNPGTVVRNPVDQLMTSCPELLRPHIASSLPHSHITQIPRRPGARPTRAG